MFDAFRRDATLQSLGDQLLGLPLDLARLQLECRHPRLVLLQVCRGDFQLFQALLILKKLFAEGVKIRLSYVLEMLAWNGQYFFQIADVLF